MLKNKVVIVTGSTSGIGKVTAIHFASLGAKLVITGRRATAIETVAKQCLQASPHNHQPLQVVADLTKDEDICNLIDSTVACYNRIDVLVNNAGIGAVTPIDAPNLMELYRNITDVNLRAPLLLIQKTTPYLEESRGNIVNVSSIATTRPIKYTSIYGLSKSEQDMLTTSLSIELGPKGIRVNSVNPGMTDTNFMHKIGLSDETVAKLKKDYAETNPLGRIAQKSDVAQLIAFLASDKASYINGVKYDIDGGALFENWPSLQIA